MLQWVYERACAAGAREVLIATDDERIISAARAFGAEAVPTAAATPQAPIGSPKSRARAVGRRKTSW